MNDSLPSGRKSASLRRWTVGTGLAGVMCIVMAQEEGNWCNPPRSSPPTVPPALLPALPVHVTPPMPAASELALAERTQDLGLLFGEGLGWSETYSLVARLADGGSASASGIALGMVCHGPRVYGQRFQASEKQLRRWRRQMNCLHAACTDAG